MLQNSIVEYKSVTKEEQRTCEIRVWNHDEETGHVSFLLMFLYPHMLENSFSTLCVTGLFKPQGQSSIMYQWKVNMFMTEHGLPSDNIHLQQLNYSKLIISFTLKNSPFRAVLSPIFLTEDSLMCVIESLFHKEWQV